MGNFFTSVLSPWNRAAVNVIQLFSSLLTAGQNKQVFNTDNFSI